MLGIRGEAWQMGLETDRIPGRMHAVKPRLRARFGWAARFGAGVLVAGCAACAVGPDFHRPAPPPDDSIAAPAATIAIPGVAGGVSQSFTPGGDIPAQWWTLFHSQALNDLVTQALRANPNVAAAQASLRQAHANVRAALGVFFPAITGTASGQRQLASGAEYGNPGGSSFIYSLFNASVNVSYSLSPFGGSLRQLESIRAQEQYQRFELEGSYLSISAEVVTTAIQEASLSAQIAATNQMVDSDSRDLAVVNRQLTLGGASRIDVLTQESEVALSQAQLPVLQRQLKQNRDLLAVLIGQPPGEQPAAQFELADLSLPEALPLSLPAKLVEQRPDVRAQENLLHEASAQVGVATANELPSLAITGSLGGASTRIGDLLKSSSGIWSIGANTSQTLFDGGTLWYQRKAQVAAYQQAAALYRATVLSALQNVADTLNALDSDADALKAQDRSERAASAALQLAQKRYAAGAISYLALLTAQRNEQQARIALVQAQAARFADTAALFQALGGGWWNRGSDAAINNPAARS
jgi:NodT family efflux transporter outer membrane factor (OMF) lipoprotein